MPTDGWFSRGVRLVVSYKMMLEEDHGGKYVLDLSVGNEVVGTWQPIIAYTPSATQPRSYAPRIRARRLAYSSAASRRCYMNGHDS